MPSTTSALAHVLALSRLRDDDVTWRLLRADNGPVVVAVLGELLGGDERRLSASEFTGRLDDELDALRGHGFALPKNAQGYTTDWREAGYLIRRPSPEARGETYELSAGALAAIRILDGLAEPRQTATESRLSSIQAQLERLAIDTDPDATRRLETLHEQRDAIDEQIERIGAGDLDAYLLDDERAVERVNDILAQVSELPSDFARVRGAFEGLNRTLRERIVESGPTQGHVLDEVFRGVDLISESEHGRSFAAFSALVLDPERGAAFDADVERVLDRSFASKLTASERRALRRFMRSLTELSGEIHDVITGFARGLRRFVQSQDFQRDRVLRRVIEDALGAAVGTAAAVPPYQQTRLALELSSIETASAGAIELHNPGSFDATRPIIANEPELVDLEALKAIARETEIDFDELTGNINVELLRAEIVTVAGVLARHTATQGVASVVGLIALAESFGERVEGETETVTWTGRGAADIDVEREALIPSYRFTRRIA
ncbi:DUF3375 domain-containing protein [Rathayibacter sp. CAU 1779]